MSDPAVKAAHEVVGLYGDPDTSWGIAVDLGVGGTGPEADLDPDRVNRRLVALCAAYEHLGRAPRVEVVSEADWAARRAELATTAFTSGALLRVALRADGRRLAVSAHHGAVDGLGLVAVAGAALGRQLATRARGIGERSSPSGFLRSSVKRMREAVLDPPPRFSGHGDSGRGGSGRGGSGRGEDLSEVSGPVQERGTAHAAAAVASVFGARGHRGVPLLVVGASRRSGSVPEPDRQTAYLRLRVPTGYTAVEVRRSVAAVDPEPDFPATSAGGIGPRLARLVRGRLGATAVLSNLGRIDGAVDSVAMFPACSGPRAVSVGLASTSVATTLTLRTRRYDFTADEHAALLAELAARFFAGQERNVRESAERQ